MTTTLQSPVIPVIHCVDGGRKQVQSNFEILAKLGVRRAWLIPQGGNPSQQPMSLKKIANLAVIGSDHGVQCGLNPLGYNTDFIDLTDFHGLWADNYRYFCGRPDLPELLPRCGGVNFKYQALELNLKQGIRNCLEVCDMVVTSGPGTGYPPDLDKIREFRKHMDDLSLATDFFPGIRSHWRPLAIASGVDHTNIEAMYEAGADYFFVGTSIEKEFGVLDSDKVKRILDASRGSFLRRMLPVYLRFQG